MCDKKQLHNQARIINNDRFLAYVGLYIAVMNNFTYFGQMVHLRVLMDSWDYQLSIEHKMDIV